MNKKIKSLGLLSFVLIAGQCFGEETNPSMVEISVKKMELVLFDDTESLFPSETLKPQMLLEEQITITNKSNNNLEYVIYDHKYKDKTLFHSHVDLGDDFVVSYSVDGGEVFLPYPVYINNKVVVENNYTDVRVKIKKLDAKKSKNIRIRYSYDHFR